MKMRVLVTLVAVVSLAGFASAEMATFSESSDPIQTPSSPDQTLLYDQTADYNYYLGTAQDFEAAYDAYDAEGADDFTVTWVDGWNVQRVGVIGGYFSGSTGPLSGMNVNFYSDSGGMPGSVVAGCSYPLNPVVDTGTGIFESDLGTPCYLPQGTYWVGVSGRLDFAVGGQWGWGYSAVQYGNPAHWQNPGNGFATGCTSWGTLASCLAGGPDYCFQIWGENAQPGPTPTPPPAVAGEPVPAMNRYGIMVMIGLLIGVAILVMWRRS